MVMGTLSSYLNQDTQTASTVASQQYYYYPVGTVGVDSATITIGDLKHTLTPIYSQQTWNFLNAMNTQPSSFPQFIYPRRDDYGIWPIPTAAYTITFNRFVRDRNLSVDDATDGTAVCTNGSITVTGALTAFTDAMRGRWFTITDTAQRGQGYWYRIASVASTTSLTLETYWAGPTVSPTTTYRIGESPEIPEEGHTILAAGTAADYYAGLKNSTESATWFNNVYWTGDGNNTIRDEDNPKIIGGLLGMLKKYKDRERDNIVMRRPGTYGPADKIFASSIT